MCKTRGQLIFKKQLHKMEDSLKGLQEALKGMKSGLNLMLNKRNKLLSEITQEEKKRVFEFEKEYTKLVKDGRIYEATELAKKFENKHD